MPDTIDASDVQGLDEAITSNPDVAYATALRHAQSHDLTSADHSDVSGAPPSADGQVLGYSVDTGLWGPGALRVSYDAAGVYEGTC